MSTDTTPAAAAQPLRKRPRLLIIAGIVTAGAAASSIALASPTILHGKQIDGTATANPGEVVAAAAERKAADEAAAKAAEAAKLTFLEGEVKLSMQEHFDDPGNARGVRFSVINVSLVKVADNKYEGMATMTADGGPQREIAVHVTADDRTLMWNTDQGALVPLFR